MVQKIFRSQKVFACSSKFQIGVSQLFGQHLGQMLSVSKGVGQNLQKHFAALYVSVWLQSLPRSHPFERTAKHRPVSARRGHLSAEGLEFHHSSFHPSRPKSMSSALHNKSMRGRHGKVSDRNFRGTESMQCRRNRFAFQGPYASVSSGRGEPHKEF